MSPFEAAEGLYTLPRRIFLEGNREPFCDPDGYVLPVGEALTAEELLAHSAVLVVAPPWTGKTFFSKELYRVLTAESADRPLPFSGFAELTCFEAFPRGSSVEPSWWQSWKSSREGACWMVDAIDEDARGDRQSHNILNLLRELPEDARARLHLLCFCRLNEVPPWFENGIEEIYGSWSPENTRGLKRLRMAGLSREAAKHYVGASRFERVCRLIRSNGLQHLASYPVVLQYLEAEPEEEGLTAEGVWARVLKGLLRETRDSPSRPVSRKEVEDLFKVSQTLAALMTFCEKQVIQGYVDLENLLPETFPEYPGLRQAAREALQTAIFERSGDGFRFSQDHIRQWLAAFALQKMSLLQVRPLLTLESGNLNQAHEGVMAHLAQISLDSEVRDWIVTQHGGLPDPSAAPWSLPDAAKALDRLQEIARFSPWGVSNWREERLKTFGSVPGINEEIARRLEEAQHPAELHLLLGTALVIGAQETVQPAIQIVIDDSQDERARALAADLVSRLGTNDDLAPLSEGLRSLDCKAWSDEALAILASSFHQRNLWSFEETAALAMAREGMGGSWLEYSLVESLSLDQARWLTKTFLLPRPDRLVRHLLREALAKILGQEQSSESDLEILIPLALRIDDLEEMRFASRLDLITFLKRNPASRRRLFLDGLRSDPERERDGAWGWFHALEGEDTRWLMDLIRQQQSSPPWLWETLYYISRGGCSSRLRRQVRQEIEANDPDLLQRLDREARKWRRYNRVRRQKDSQKEHITYSLEPLLRDLLQKTDVDLHQKMLRISRWCFVKPAQRPTNLEGRWEDLPSDLRDDVLRICRQALEECGPTPIPETPSFSSWTLLEAACFDRLVRQDEAFRLTPTGIRKWFPSWLRAWQSDWGISILRVCFEADRSLSEDVLLEGIRRDVRSGMKSTHSAVPALPPDLWSERLAAKLEEEIVSKPEVDAEVRIDLLVWIGRRFPDRARPIAISWANEAMPGPDTESLRIAGIDILLMTSPQEGWERLEWLTQQEEPRSVLRRMRSLLTHHYGPQADFTTWPAERLSRLEELLFRAFPPEDDPEWDYGEVRSLGGDDDLQSLRDKLPSLLFKREEEEDHATLERLAHKYPRIREWLDDVRAQQGAEGVLSGLGRSARQPQGRAVPLGQMIKLLRDSNYRVLGSAEDLQNVVLEQLQLMARDAKQHLSLLYHPRPRERGKSRERLEEDALQAYLYCRLRDRLPAVLGEKGLKVEPAVDRETLAARDRRNDLKIQAPSTADRLLTVIVEIKWSDNDKISTSQVEQLGRDYLLLNDLTHGIYLVGWSGAPGRWKKQALGSAPQPRSCPRAWEQALEEQAKLFGIEQPRLLIRPLVLDLAW